MRFVDEHNEATFWKLLASKLANRDLAGQEVLSTAESLEGEQRALNLFEIIGRYEKEFAENRLDNVRRVVKAAGLQRSCAKVAVLRGRRDSLLIIDRARAGPGSVVTPSRMACYGQHPAPKARPAALPQHEPPDGGDPGFLLEREYTTPTLADMQVTPNGHVLARPDEEAGVGHTMHLGVAVDLRAHLSRLGMAAKLDEEAWARFAGMVQSRLGMVLGDLQARTVRE